MEWFKYCTCNISTHYLRTTYNRSAHSLSRVRLFATPCTVAHRAPLSMGFSRQENWRGLSFPSPGGLPYPGTEATSLAFPVLAGRFFTTSRRTTSSLYKYITFCLSTKHFMDIWVISNFE